MVKDYHWEEIGSLLIAQQRHFRGLCYQTITGLKMKSSWSSVLTKANFIWGIDFHCRQKPHNLILLYKFRSFIPGAILFVEGGIIWPGNFFRTDFMGFHPTFSTRYIIRLPIAIQKPFGLNYHAMITSVFNFSHFLSLYLAQQFLIYRATHWIISNWYANTTRLIEIHIKSIW